MNNFALGFSFHACKIKRVAKMMCKDVANLEVLSDVRAERQSSVNELPWNFPLQPKSQERKVRGHFKLSQLIL